MQSEYVNLPERQAAFIRNLIAEGRYGDIHEAIRANVLLMEERIAHEERQREKLRTMMDEAFAGGVVEESFDEIWDAAETRHLKGDA